MSPDLCRLLSSLLIIHAAFDFAKAWRNFDIIYKNVTCHHETKKILSLNCSIAKNADNKNALTVYMMAAENIYFKEVRIEVVMVFHGKRDRIVNLKFNGCALEESGMKSMALRIALEKLQDKNTSNFMELCPCKANKLYYVKDYVPSPERYPPYTPSMQYYNLITPYEGSVMLAQYVLFAEIVQKSDLKKKRPKPKRRP